MSKYIGVAAALAVVGIFFYGDKFDLPLIDNLNLGVNTVPADPVGNKGMLLSAWQIFEQYRTYATEGNLDGVKSISHQVSETCRNPETIEECNRLMASVAEFTRDLRRDDFTETYYDDRQIVMLTEPAATIEGDSLVQVILFFTRTPAGEPRVLGMRFCFKGKEGGNQSCFNSDPAARDLDNNGWWDDVESLFYK